MNLWTRFCLINTILFIIVLKIKASQFYLVNGLLRGFVKKEIFSRHIWNIVKIFVFEKKKNDS